MEDTAVDPRDGLTATELIGEVASYTVRTTKVCGVDTKIYSMWEVGNRELIRSAIDGHSGLSKDELGDIVNRWTGRYTAQMWRDKFGYQYVSADGMTLMSGYESYALRKIVIGRWHPLGMIKDRDVAVGRRVPLKRRGLSGNLRALKILVALNDDDTLVDGVCDRTATKEEVVYGDI